MKKIYWFVIAVTVVFGNGWAIEKAQVSPKVKPLPPTVAPIRTHSQAEANFSVASEVNTKVRVAFNWNSSENTFCANLAERLAGKAILDKAEIVPKASADVEIVILSEFELVDKSGEYYRINCTKVSVSIVSKEKVYAMTTVEPKALPRKLGAQKAKNQYLPQVVEELVPFFRKELERLSNEHVVVCVVDFALANMQEKPDARYVAAQVNKIAQILSSTPGIISFSNIRQDVSKATCSYRIVYLKKQFPQGISNVLNLKLAGK